MVLGSVEPQFLLNKLSTAWESGGLTPPPHTHTHCTPSPPADQTNLLSKRLVDWLRYASIQQGLPYSGGFFSTPRTRQVSPHYCRGVEMTNAPSQAGYVAQVVELLASMYVCTSRMYEALGSSPRTTERCTSVMLVHA